MSRGIDVDDHLQTSVAGVYAIGDITSQPVPKLTTVAELEADYLYRQLVRGGQEPLRYPTIGTAAFAFPEIAQAGVNPEEAVDDSRYQVVEHDLSFGSFYAGLNEQGAKLTVVYDRDQRLVGASEIGATAADDINNLVPVIGLQPSSREWQRKVLPAYPALADKVFGLLKR